MKGPRESYLAHQNDFKGKGTMSKLNKILGWVATFLTLGLGATTAQAVVVDFDEFASPPTTCCYVNTGVGGTLVYPDVTVSGGVVMNFSGWSSLQTSGDNLYGSSAGQSTLHGVLDGIITLDFATGVSNLSFDVINGAPVAGEILVSVYDTALALIDSVAIAVGAFDNADAVSSYFTALGDIGRVVITKETNINVAIDTISFDVAAVPAPGVLVLVVFGLASLSFARRRA